MNECIDEDAMLKIKCECQLLMFAEFGPYLSKTWFETTTENTRGTIRSTGRSIKPAGTISVQDEGRVTGTVHPALIS